MVLLGEDLNGSSFITRHLYKMTQTQTKVQPTIRTQPTIRIQPAAQTMPTKTTTPVTTPTKTTTPETTQQGTFQNLQRALVDFFKGLYSVLTSPVARQPASVFEVGRIATGTAPIITSPASQKIDVFIAPKTLPTAASTPAVSLSTQQGIERKKEEERLKSEFAGRQVDFSKIRFQPSTILPTAASTPAVSSVFQPTQTTQQTQLSPKTTTTAGATKTDKMGKPLVETISGFSEDQLFNLSQSPFAQDIQSLTTITFPGTTTQTISNVPPGVDIQIFRDPLGGSTPFFGYTIKPGDTLTKIAKAFGVSIEDILRINKDKTDAIKNVPGRPFGDIIIAGKEIRIPVVQKEIKQPPLLGQKVGSADEINQKAKESLQTPQIRLDENKLNQLILEKTGIDLSRIDETISRLNQLNDPNFYVNQYNQLLERTGLSRDIQALADIRSIMERTKQDVLEEAAKVGGLVTESQVAEVVNFRHGILKAQYQALADAIEAKERLIDKIMKYTAMDRKMIADLLENQLKLEKWKAELAMNAVKWDFNAQKELRDRNLKKLENYADAGELHTASADFLYNFVNPESPLYAGIDANELRFYIRISQEKARQRELDEIRTKQLIQKTLEDIQRARAKEARAWAKEMRERELHPLRKRRLEKLIEEEEEETLDPETY
jgi:LysM repeat protein